MPRVYVSKDRVGETYGRLTLVARSSQKASDGAYKWVCRCQCGGSVVVAIHHLRTGNVKSCGCLHKEKTVERLKVRNTTHGHSVRGERTATYRTWRSIFDRLKNDPDYEGVELCERWLKFENFLEDMGERPEGKTLDRKDNSSGYCKENCRWADDLEQANNRTNNVYLSHEGRTQSLAQWLRELGLPYESNRRKFHKMGKPSDFVLQLTAKEK